MKNEKWTVENVPDQTGKVAIVTGSSSGIGFETARVLANKGALVVMAVRNLEKGERAKGKILAQNSGAQIRLMELDLADLKSVARFSDNFEIEFSRLDIVIN